LRNRFPIAALPAAPAAKRRATLADVADRAHVSSSTASRALSGRGTLSPATRDAVVEAAAELGYRPSPLARSLRMRRTHTIGLVVPDISSPFYAATLRGAQSALERSGYRLMLMDSAQEVGREAAALATLIDHQVDGLLLATTGISADRFDEIVGGSDTPCVFFDEILPDRGRGSVGVENARGIDLLVGHLVGHGHRRIALLTGPAGYTSSGERRAGYELALTTRGLPVDPELIRAAPWSIEDGRASTDALLELADAPTALVATSTELALGCLAACRARGIDLPGDLALVCFDDPYFGALLEPALTCVAYDAAAIGSEAASILIGSLDDGDGYREGRIDVELVVRRSCGCAWREPQ
jgi:LacI family transcriptional regulator